MTVYLQERLRSRIVLTYGARKCLAAEGCFVIYITGVNTRGYQSAVEQHRSCFLVQRCTCPYSCADSIALITRAVGAGCGNRRSKRIELLHHVRISRITAAGKQDTLCRIDTDDIAGSFLCDDSGNTPFLILLEFYQTGIKVNAVSQFFNVILESVSGHFASSPDVNSHVKL